MKTPTITIIILLFGFHLSAQITLEHSYTQSGNLTELDENEFKYFMMDVPMKQCKIYNTDHTLFKSINLPVPEGYFLYDMKYVSRNIFNDDDKIELLYIYYKIQVVNAKEVYYYGMKVINESGEVLVSLKDGAFAEILDVAGEPKLVAWQYIWSDYFYLIYTNVYSIGGSNASAIINRQDQLLKLFPNPAQDLVNIVLDPEGIQSDERIVLSDMQGKIMKNISIEEGSQRVTFPTADLTPGTYIINRVSNGEITGSAKMEKSQ